VLEQTILWLGKGKMEAPGFSPCSPSPSLVPLPDFWFCVSVSNKPKNKYNSKETKVAWQGNAGWYECLVEKQ